MSKLTDTGIEYIIECIRKSPTGCHYAALTDSTRLVLEQMGYKVKSPTKGAILSKISWPKI